MESNAVKKIEIVLGADGIEIDPRTFIYQGDTLEWSCAHPFALDVRRSDELFGKKLPPAALRGQQNKPVRHQSAGKATTGSYQYAVSVWDGTDLWVLDPEILVVPTLMSQ